MYSITNNIKGGDIMRKYIIGGLIGAALATSFNASAAVESIIGKTVESTAAVKLNGQKLEKDSIIVDGSSYAPVRVIGESLGLAVDFKNNEIVLEKKPKEEAKVTDPVSQAQKEPAKPAKTLLQVNDQIDFQKNEIWVIKAGIESFKSDDPRLPELKERLKKYEDELAELEKEKAELTQQQK